MNDAFTPTAADVAYWKDLHRLAKAGRTYRREGRLRRREPRRRSRDPHRGRRDRAEAARVGNRSRRHMTTRSGRIRGAVAPGHRRRRPLRGTGATPQRGDAHVYRGDGRAGSTRPLRARHRTHRYINRARINRGATGAGWKAMPSWWGWTTANTLDRATAHLPALLYERLDEIGIDFTILYPSMTLAYLEVADDELIGLRCPRQPALANLFAPVRRSHHRRRAGSRCSTPSSRIVELEYAVRELGFKTAVFAGHRNGQSASTAAIASTHSGSTTRSTTTRSGPSAWSSASRPSSTARSRGTACHVIGHELRVQPHRRARGKPRIAVQVAVPLRRHSSVSHAPIRVPRRWRGVGVQPPRRPRGSLGEAQRRVDPFARSGSPRCRRAPRAVRALRRRPCAAGLNELRVYFTRPSRVPNSSTSSRRPRSTRSRRCATGSCRTSTSAARPTTASWRGRSPSTSTRRVPACVRSSVPTSRTGTCPT